MAYAEIRPVHVADLLSREGHPLAARMSLARDERSVEAAIRGVDSGRASRRALGMAAGAALVVGTVMAGAFGFGHDQSSSPAAAGEPLGAAPSPGRPLPGMPAAGQPDTPKPAGTAPVAVAPAQAQTAPAFVAVPVPGPATQIGRPASVAPPAKPASPAPPASTPSQPNQNQLAPPTQQQSTGPVQAVAGTVSPTLGGVVAPVTGVVDDALTPALSMIGGLLGG